MNTHVRLLTTFAIAGALISLAAPALAEMSLRLIMRDLSTNAEAITRAVGDGDLLAVEENARKIADHEKPPVEERMRILSFLKDDAAGFKGADARVHDSASMLADAAAAGDMPGVLENFNLVLTGCVECHTKYRDRIIEHFYGGK